MTYDGFLTQAEIDEKKKHKEQQKVVVHQGCTERLKSVFRNAAEKHSKDVQEITDGVSATVEGNAEDERYKNEVLELVALESGKGGRVNTGERLKIYHRHESRCQILQRQFKAGELTPLKKEK